jgi:hypothetical protein
MGFSKIVEYIIACIYNFQIFLKTLNCRFQFVSKRRIELNIMIVPTADDKGGNRV